MKYFGIEIFEGKPFHAECTLDESLSMEDQYGMLGEDIENITYKIYDYDVCIDIGYYGLFSSEAFFRVEVIIAHEQKETFKRILIEFALDFVGLKKAIQLAVDCVQSLKSMSIEEFENVSEELDEITETKYQKCLAGS